MGLFFDFNKTFNEMGRALKHGTEDEKKNLLNKFKKNSRSCIPKLIEKLNSSLFDADIWAKESDVARIILVLLFNDQKTRHTVIKHLDEAGVKL